MNNGFDEVLIVLFFTGIIMAVIFFCIGLLLDNIAEKKRLKEERMRKAIKEIKNESIAEQEKKHHRSYKDEFLEPKNVNTDFDVDFKIDFNDAVVKTETVYL